MPLIQYKNIRLQEKSLKVVAQANEILEDYEKQGFVLTLRQLYYQFVARNLLPNTDASYDRLGQIVNDARLAGLIDWDHIEDRTRYLLSIPHWDSPADAIAHRAKEYAIEMWDRKYQDNYVEVWVEKDALVGVIERPCNKFDVPYFSCRGYVSQSEMWKAGRRLGYLYNEGQTVTILHLGDHDPSGIDMTRDIQDRLDMFVGGEFVVNVKRIALNMKQIRKYKPPPNPTKVTDSRSPAYIAEYGNESWELDALEPKVLDALVTKEIEKLCDDRMWNRAVRRLKKERKQLQTIAEEYRYAD